MRSAGAATGSSSRTTTHDLGSTPPVSTPSDDSVFTSFGAWDSAVCPGRRGDRVVNDPIQRLLVGCLAAFAIALAGYRRRALTGDGAAAAVVVGTTIVAAGGWWWGVLVVAFFA